VIIKSVVVMQIVVISSLSLLLGGGGIGKPRRIYQTTGPPDLQILELQTSELS